MGSFNLRRVVTIPLLLGASLGVPRSRSPHLWRRAPRDRRRNAPHGYFDRSYRERKLPPGRGTAKEGAQVYVQKACIGCHGAAGIGGLAPILQSKQGAAVPVWKKRASAPTRTHATSCGFHHRGMPSGWRGL